MAPRSNWKGFLKLSLVSCPVQLYPATTSKERVTFNLLNRETGNRLRRRLVDPDTNEEVDAADQVKGYQVAKNEYVLVEEDEIDAVAIESTHTIDIEAFVPRSEIDETFLDTPYYLGPDGKMGEEAFAVIREAMREKDVVGIGRVVLYRRERPIMLQPRGKGSSPRPCATPTRCATTPTISRTLKTSKCRTRCSTSPPTSSAARCRALTQSASRIVTKRPCWT